LNQGARLGRSAVTSPAGLPSRRPTRLDAPLRPSDFLETLAAIDDHIITSVIREEPRQGEPGGEAASRRLAPGSRRCGGARRRSSS